MSKDTKEKILQNAFEMFANRGYEGTNIRELSDALGVSKGAMYRHFKSKEELWDSVVAKIDQDYAEHIGKTDSKVRIPNSIDELINMTLGMMNYTMHDPNLIKGRKMMIREQYRDEKVAILSDRYFLTNMETLFKEVFKGMIENKIFKDDDFNMMSLEYTACISALINQRDRFPNKEDEIIEKGKAYINYFIKVHKYENQ